MIKAVLDTNQFVSSLLSKKGVQAKLLDAWKADFFELAISPWIIDEIQRVLNYSKIRKKYKISSTRINALISMIKIYATIVPGQTKLYVIKDDPADNNILSCAVEAQAHFIVSGDAHLLNLNEYEGIDIVTGKTFLNYLKSQFEHNIP